MQSQNQEGDAPHFLKEILILHHPDQVEYIVHVCVVAGEDYNGSSITVYVPAGVTMQPVTINIIDNNIVECNEMFNVTMVPVTTCGVTIGNDGISEVMIRDDDSKYKFIID